MKISLFVLLLWSFSSFAYQGDLYSVEYQSTVSSILVPTVRSQVCPHANAIDKIYGFKNYKVTYETVDVNGRPVYSMGLLIIPDTQGPFSKLVYQHGTLFSRRELPSSLPDRGEGTAIGYCFASIGYVSILPDYLGFGDSTGVHPYLYGASEAVVARDMMRAVNTALSQLRIAVNEKLFIAGYSQGGHAAMSLLKNLEEDEEQEFTVTAAAPMAGPYSLTKTTEKILAQPSVHSAAELAYLLVGLNPIYGFYQNIEDVLRPEYAAVVPKLFDGTHDWDDVLTALPITPDQLLKPEVLEVYRQVNSPFMYALSLNENYRWVPRTPLRLYHGGGDNEVPFENSVEAYNFMKYFGAQVDLINLGANVDHHGGFSLAIGQAAVWFETF